MAVTNHRKGLTAAYSKAGQDAVEAYKAKHPEAANLKIKKSVAAYVPRSKEVRDLPVRAVAWFLGDPANLTKTNAELAAELGKDIGRKVPQNLLTERFNARQRAQVSSLLEGRKVSLDLAANDTPSKIKRALRGKASAAAGSMRATVTVVFSDDAVTVGDRRYPVSRSADGPPRIAVDQNSKLNVDVLKRLLFGPT